MIGACDRREGGFTLIELLVASAITLPLAAAVFDLVQRAHGSFQSQPEVADMHQRMRAGIDVITKDLLMAGAGLQAGAAAPLLPYGDAGQGITIRYVPYAEADMVSHTYYLRSDPATDAYQLMHYDGEQTDLPVVDRVVVLAFEYYDGDGQVLEAGALEEGSWNVRRVRVLLRVRAAPSTARAVPDYEIQFDIAPRNMNLGG